MTIRAALLDEQGVYQGMDELADESALTPRHLPQITTCDLPPGQYRWIADETNPFGGAFWPLKWLNRVAATRAAVEQAKQRREALLARRAALKARREGRSPS